MGALLPSATGTKPAREVPVPAGTDGACRAPPPGTVGGMQIKGNVSEPAGRAWDRFRLEHGLTTAALIAAIAEDMAAGRWQPSKRTVELARKIDRERHSRR